MTTMFAQTSSLTTSTTSSSTPQNKVTHTVSAPTGQSFIVFFSANATVSSTATRAKIDCVVDGSTVATFSPVVSATAEDHNIFFFHQVTGKTANFDCKIDYSSTNNTNNVTIQHAVVTVWRYDSIAGLDLQYAEANSGSTGLTASYVDGASASFTPSSTGNYFVLGALGIAPGSTTVSSLARMVVDGTNYPLATDTTAYWAREAQSAVTDAFYSFNTGIRQSLATGGSRTVKVQASNESGTTGTWQYSRILAFREDAFTTSNYTSADTASQNTTTATTYQTRGTVTTSTPGASSDYLVIAGIHHGLVVVPSEAERSQVQVVVDGTEVQMSEMRYKEPSTPSDRVAMGVAYMHTDAAAFTVTTAHRLQNATDDSSAAKNSYIIILKAMDVSNDYSITVSDSITVTDSFGPYTQYYFDASDGGPTDPDSNWTNDANAFDGSISTSATVGVAGSTSSNYLQGDGTNADDLAIDITQVRARLYVGGTPDGSTMAAAIYSNGLGALLGTPTANNTSAGYGSYTTLSAPSGGWTWSAIQALETKIYMSVDNGINQSIRKVELEISVKNVNVALPVSTSDSITVEDIPRYYDDEILVLESVQMFVEAGDGSLSVNESESITVTESVTVDLDDPLINVSDSITVSESLTVRLESDINVSDTITTTESSNIALVHQINKSDSITVTEAIARTLISDINESESITVSETLYALQIDKKYTRGEVNSLPTNNADLTTQFTQQEYTDVATSDDTRVTQ